MGSSREVAEVLLEIKAVGFKPDEPITFKSGIKSPVYVDNRILPFHPEKWLIVLDGLAGLIESNGIDFDVVAGIESAGIPHSAALGYKLRKPSVFVRKTEKDHGTKKMVEGGDVNGKRVLLIEDHVSTGGSSLKGVESLRQAGAVVTACLAITSYEFAQATEAFQSAGVDLLTVTRFSAILEVVKEKDLLDEEKIEIVQDWLDDPHGWAEKYGF